MHDVLIGFFQWFFFSLIFSIHFYLFNMLATVLKAGEERTMNRGKGGQLYFR